MIVIPAGVDCTIVPSFVWTKHWNVKERQTHTQTDRYTDRSPLDITASVCIASNADPP